MREHLNCRLVDVVALTDRLDMWLDDEGLYTQPINEIATALARRHAFVWQPYHGPVLLCSVDRSGASSRPRHRTVARPADPRDRPLI